MSLRDLSDGDLADIAARAADLLAGTELSAIDSNVRAELLAALGNLPEELSEHSAAQLNLENAKIAATTLKNAARERVLGVMNRIDHGLKTGLAPREQFDLCGLDYPAPRATKYVAQDPTELSAYGFSNGTNKGRFKSNNKRGLVTFEIWRREGTDGLWHLHATESKQTFIDTGVVPGQFYEYRIRAVATQTVSNFSNSALVYGVL